MKIKISELRKIVREAMSDDRYEISFADALKEFPEEMNSWLEDYGGSPDDVVTFEADVLYVDRVIDRSTWYWNKTGQNWVFDGGGIDDYDLEQMSPEAVERYRAWLDKTNGRSKQS